MTDALTLVLILGVLFFAVVAYAKWQRSRERAKDHQ